MNLITKQDALTIREINGEPTISSLRIAEVTNKRHDNVKRDIENMFKELNIDATKFSGTYIYGNNNKAIYYLLPERELQILVSGYSIKHRADLIDELMSYRKNKNITQPSYQIEDPIKRAERWIEEQKEKLALVEKIEQDKPKVEFATNVTKAINSINIGSYAKALSEEYGVKIGQNKLFKWLRENGYLIKDGRRKNDPMQKYLDNNYFIVKIGQVATTNGIRETRTTLITGFGQVQLSDKVIKHFKGE